MRPARVGERRGPMRPRYAVATALALDAAAILLFSALGRRNHDGGVTPGGVVATAWPFLIGAAVGWLLARGWRRPGSIVATGVVVWVATVVIGMALRKATSQGVAGSFVVVATVVTGLLLLGWRALLRRRVAADPQRRP